jgi:hypothetical protein
MNMGTAVLRVCSNIKRTEAHQFYIKPGFYENKQQMVFEINLPAGIQNILSPSSCSNSLSATE